MERRKFLRESSYVALSIGVFGKIKWDGKAYVGYDPTTTDILGPFYRPGAPFKTDLVERETKGEILHFGGTIFEKDGKTPAKGTLVEIWHCNENGVYDNTSDDYVYRASFKTSADGKYNFRTIHPVPYSTGQTTVRPAHIHMRISGEGGSQDLVTQIYFKGDKYIPGDSSSSDPKSLNRILETTTNANNEKFVKFDVYLRNEYPLDMVAYKKIAGLYEMSDKSMVEFYKNHDQLFAKWNGQIMEAMDYVGNNSFEGGLAQVKVNFEIGSDGSVKAKLSYLGDAKNIVTIDGAKLLKY